MVSAYDVRTAVKDQIVSVGAKFVTLDVEGAQAEGSGGYAKAMDEAFYARQRELMLNVIKEHDVVITTAAVPARKRRYWSRKAMVEAMAPGSVIVDIAAVRGGNCELTQVGSGGPAQRRDHRGPFELRVDGSVPCEPDVLRERRDVLEAPHRIPAAGKDS